MYLRENINLNIQQWVLEIYSVVDIERMFKTLYNFPF